MPTLPITKAEAKDWLLRFQNAGDSFDSKAFAALFAENGTLQFSNYPIVTGRKHIEAMMEQSFSILDMMKHTIRYLDIVGPLIYQAVSIRYRAKGDTVENEVEIPGFATMLLISNGEEEGLIERAEVFINNQPVLDRVHALATKQGAAAQ